MHFAGKNSTMITGDKDERRDKERELIRNDIPIEDTKEMQALPCRRKSEYKKTKETYSCLSCHRTFKNKTSFTMHARFECGHKKSLNSSSDQRYECVQCGRSYKYEKSLPLHMRFECRRKDCLSSIRVPNSDTINVAELTNNFECTRCGHLFYCEKTFAFHMQVECDLSQTAISRAPTSNSKNDSEVDVFEEVKKRCKCGLCGRSYKYEKSLILHHRFDCRQTSVTS